MVQRISALAHARGKVIYEVWSFIRGTICLFVLVRKMVSSWFYVTFNLSFVACWEMEKNNVWHFLAGIDVEWKDIEFNQAKSALVKVEGHLKKLPKNTSYT